MTTTTKRVLFVCEGNVHRSPTAQRLYSATPGIDARSAGLSSLARVQVTDELLALLTERRTSHLGPPTAAPGES